MTASSPRKNTTRAMTLHATHSGWPVTSKRLIATGASDATITWMPTHTTMPMYATSYTSLDPLLRIAMSAPKPTKTPAISASDMNRSTSGISRHLPQPACARHDPAGLCVGRRSRPARSEAMVGPAGSERQSRTSPRTPGARRRSGMRRAPEPRSGLNDNSESGSGGRIRTYGQAVNSRPLYH